MVLYRGIGHQHKLVLMVPLANYFGTERVRVVMGKVIPFMLGLLGVSDFKKIITLIFIFPDEFVFMPDLNQASICQYIDQDHHFRPFLTIVWCPLSSHIHPGYCTVIAHQLARLLLGFDTIDSRGKGVDSMGSPDLPGTMGGVRYRWKYFN